MDFVLTDAQMRFQKVARDFSAETLRPQAPHFDETGEFPVENLAQMARLGLMGVNIRSEWGGSAEGVVAYSLAVTEVAAADPAVAVTMAVNNMVGEVLQEFASDAHKAQYIPRLLDGTFSSGSFCLSEPGSGSDAAGMLTRATRTEAGWSISGAKAWITSGAHAALFLVWARTEAVGAKEPEITLFLVDANTPGVVIGKAEHKMGQHASNTVPVTFEQVEVGHDAIVGHEGQGFKIAMMALDGGRIGIASQSVGIAREALERARLFMRQNPIASQGQSRELLAEAWAEYEAARSLTLRAAWLKEQAGRKYSREAAIAKLFASEVATKACQTALTIMGPEGLRPEHGVEKLLRDARVTRIYEGTSEVQRIVIARDVIRAGL